MYCFYFYTILKICFFYVTSLFTLFSSMLVISFNNTLYSVWSIVFSYLFNSIIFVLLNLDFIAFFLSIVYLGALVVVLLFVVMMLNIKLLEMNRIPNYFPFLFGVLFSLFQIFFYLFPFFRSNLSFFFFFFLSDWSFHKDFVNSFISFSFSLFNDFFISFVFLGLILLIAMIGCIFLTLTTFRFFKKQESTFQVLYETLNFI